MVTDGSKHHVVFTSPFQRQCSFPIVGYCVYILQHLGIGRRVTIETITPTNLMRLWWPSAGDGTLHCSSDLSVGEAWK